MPIGEGRNVIYRVADELDQEVQGTLAGTEEALTGMMGLFMNVEASIEDTEGRIHELQTAYEGVLAAHNATAEKLANDADEVERQGSNRSDIAEGVARMCNTSDAINPQARAGLYEKHFRRAVILMAAARMEIVEIATAHRAEVGLNDNARESVGLSAQALRSGADGM